MYRYTSKDGVNRSIRTDYFEGKSLQEMISMMFKGKTMDFPAETSLAGYLLEAPPPAVSIPCFLVN